MQLSSYACAIPDQEAVVITGGVATSRTVSVYNDQGWVEDMSQLNTGRYQHACTSYMSGEKRVRNILVHWFGFAL